MGLIIREEGQPATFEFTSPSEIARLIELGLADQITGFEEGIDFILISARDNREEIEITTNLLKNNIPMIEAKTIFETLRTRIIQ